MSPGALVSTIPDKAAVVMSDSGASLTYRELDEQAQRLANRFHEMGLEPGDHVAFCIENRLEFFPIMWAAHYAGLYYTAISTHLTPVEIAYIVEDSGAELFIASTGIDADPVEIANATPGARIRLCLGGDVPGYERIEPIMATGPTAPTRPRAEGRDMLYSSGTTGRPKGIKAPLSGLPLDDAPDPLVSLVTLVFGASSDTVYLSPAPLYHAAPLRFCRSMQKVGATVVVMPRFDPVGLLRAIEQHGVTITQMVPTMFIRCLRLDDQTRRSFDLSSLEAVIHAAAPCPVPVKHAMIDWLGPIIHEYYAGTEGQGFVYCNSEQWLAHEGTVGLPLRGAIHIVDENGHELHAGEVGTVYFESDTAFEYHGDSAKTEAITHREGWTTLGDIGRLDEDGYLYLTDRKDFTIISGGVNIYPQEAENVLTLHPAVADVAVFGVPDEDLGEVVKAVVSPADPDSAGPELEQELIDFCRARLAREKCPRSIDFRDELPRHPTGKLYKRLLRDEYGTA